MAAILTISYISKKLLHFVDDGQSTVVDQLAKMQAQMQAAEARTQQFPPSLRPVEQTQPAGVGGGEAVDLALLQQQAQQALMQQRQEQLALFQQRQAQQALYEQQQQQQQQQRQQESQALYVCGG